MKQKLFLKKGQLSIINIFWWLIIVALGAVATPLLGSFANTCITNALVNDTLTPLLCGAIVPFLWIGIIITFFIFVIPQGLRQNP